MLIPAKELNCVYDLMKTLNLYVAVEKRAPAVPRLRAPSH